MEDGFWRIGIKIYSGPPWTFRDRLSVLEQGISDMAASLDAVFVDEPES